MNAVRTLIACLLSLLTIPLAAGAQTWAPLGPAGGFIGRVFVAPSQPTTLFAIPGNDAGGLFKSTNSGDTWQSISGGFSAGSCDIHVQDVAVHPTQPATIYAATRALGVCKSTDGGTTWTQSVSGLPNDANQYQRPVLSIAINPQTPTVLFAGTEAGVYVSVNSGSTWALSGAVNQSGASNQPILSVAFAPSAANTAYAYIRGTVYKTSDGGTTWAPTANLSPSTAKNGRLTVSPASPNTVLLVVDDNVYRTTTGAVSWAVSTSGAAGASFYGNVSIDPTNTNTMFLTAVGSCGLCKSTDGGATWAAVGATGLPSAFGFTNLAITTTIDPLTPSRMFAGTPNGPYRSTNTGATWTSITTGFNGLLVGALALGGDTPASAYVAIPSVDEGTDVFKLSGGVPPFGAIGSPLTAQDSGDLSDLVVDPTNASIIYAAGGKSSGSTCGQVYKSTNGGTSWTTINPSTVPSTHCAGPLVMDLATPSTLYLGVFNPTGGTQTVSVYKTTNGGTSWSSASTGISFSVRRLAISRRTPALLYASSGSQVFKTANSGGSWTTTSSLPSGSNSSTGRLAIDPTDDNIVYVATSFGVYGTTNGGTAWTAKTGGWPTINGKLYGADALAIDPTTPTTVYAGTATPNPGPGNSFQGTRALGTGLYKSTDSGATWTSATAVLSGVSVFDLAFDGTRAIYAATNNGVFRFGTSNSPTVAIDRNSLVFSAVTTGAAFVSQTSAQAVRIVQTGGTAAWTVASSAPWLVVSPAAGTGSATLSVSVQFASGLAASQTGTLTLAFTGAANTAGPITVTLNSVTSTAAAVPFGSFDTPTDGSTGVAGSIAVTGWAMDDVEITRVRIMRDPVAGEPAGTLVFIGNAVFVDGARPDVQASYPTLPRASRAGWGYLMLTNFLPGLGNGTFKLYAVAEDADGHSTTLGSKTITCSNGTATTPFGAIDTPAQGETVTTASLNNFGWVLSPGSRKANPSDGGTVRVVIDGALGASPSGWTSRSDLTALFPVAQFSGIASALGVATLDMTTLSNAVHTISWLVTDNSSPALAAGIGSRYFTVSNGSLLLDPTPAGSVTRGHATVIPSNALLAPPSAALQTAPVDAEPMAGRRGFDPDTPLQPYAVTDGRATVQSEELDRIELHLEGVDGSREGVQRTDRRGAKYAGYLRVGDGLAALPAGSSLNAESGEFTWQPGVAFVGTYDLVFARLEGSTPVARRDVRVVLNPKGSNRVGPQTVIDIADGRLVAGWAVDLDSQIDTGVDTLHVWAYPVEQGRRGDPIFVGAVEYGGARPDVAAIYGERFLNSGYGIRVEGLAGGTYDLAVFAYSTVTDGFVPAKVVRVIIR